ncbi:phosphatidylinositol phosphate synthase [Nakamurella leprariae]|uniref:Phosphatidylinositol phosphate synthase n=1 Tax=Nakamurella leprariae TaxID=2803911 RepID=A0A938Y6Q4_9ACTN|nr:CDP-alcohol phosphatidyltransferase family protein [Nakamurella leprariae]MBM9467056.1 CDP-alcohol phosphatidyltransferase family protein [Nakamurella leprariae]
MLNSVARSSVSKVTDPIGRGLLRAGFSPDLVTVIGTVGVVGGSIGLLATGHLFIGTLVVTVFVLFDLLDGAMARARGYGTDFGLVLDASCDRIADGALFGALAFYAFTHADAPGGSAALGAAALVCLVTGQVISYVKARADSVGLPIGGALAERAERNLLGLVGAGLTGLGLDFALPVCLWLLAAAGLVTVVQRLLQVRTAALAAGKIDAPRRSARAPRADRPYAPAGRTRKTGRTAGRTPRVARRSGR